MVSANFKTEVIAALYPLKRLVDLHSSVKIDEEGEEVLERK